MKSTLFKYILSYIVLFLIFISSCFILFEVQIKPEVLEKDNQRRLGEIESVFDILDTQFTQLQLVANKLTSKWAPSLLEMSQIVQQYQVASDIVSEKSVNFLLSEILFFSHQSKEVVSTSYPVSYEKDRYIMYDIGGSVDLSPYPLFDYNTKMLFRVSGDNSSYLCYLPNGQSSQSRVLFILNDSELGQYFQLGDSFETLGLVDINTGEILYQTGEEIEKMPVLSEVSQEYHQKFNDSYLYLSPTQWNNYSVFGIKSEASLLQEQNSIFFHVYLTLIVFGIAAFIFICFALRITYLPLYQLTKRIAKDTTLNNNHLEVIDNLFKAEKAKAVKMQNRLSRYQATIQYHLLGDFFDLSHISKNEQEKLESVFQIECQHMFFLAKIFFTKEITSKALQNTLQKALGEQYICVLLQAHNTETFILLDDISQTDGTNEILINLLEELSLEFECNILLSNSAQSPKEIPSLYANLHVTSALEDIFKTKRVVQFKQTLKKNEHLYGDRYRLVEQMEALFKLRNFPEINQRVQDLFHSLEDGNLPEYYVKSILIELLALICKYANHDKIQYETYEDCYNGILSAVRNANYLSTKEKLQNDFLELIAIYEKNSVVGTVSVETIKNYIQNNYHDVDFSLSRLADEMQVSSAYLSFLYKKNTGMNLSEYVWEVRKQKMITLLTTTNLNIEQISALVGYDNVSSLRRKFKQDTGKTPNQIRREL